MVVLSVRCNYKLFKATRTPLGKAQVNVLVSIAYISSLPYAICRLVQSLIHISVYLGQEQSLCSATEPAGVVITILGSISWICLCCMLLGIAFYLEAVRQAFNINDEERPSRTSLKPWRNKNVKPIFLLSTAVLCTLIIINSGNCIGGVSNAFEAAYLGWGIVLVLVGITVWSTSYALVQASTMGSAKFLPMIRMAGTAFTSSLLLGALFLLVALNRSLGFRDISIWSLIIRIVQTIIEVG